MPVSEFCVEDDEEFLLMRMGDGVVSSGLILCGCDGVDACLAAAAAAATAFSSAAPRATFRPAWRSQSEHCC